MKRLLKHLTWTLLIPLALSACSSVTPGAPLEPQALILTVTREGDSGPGTLRRAIELADPESTITFADNVRTITLSSRLVIDKNLTIVDPEGGSVTISGGGTVGVMAVQAGITLNLDGMTISDGSESLGGSGGGGILNLGTLNVTNSTFSRNNSAWYGGGLYNNGGTLNVTNSTFSRNGAQFGGGIFNRGGTLNVTNSTFSSNSATYGGGIYNHGILNVTNGTLARNSASQDGGGIYTEITLNLTNSIVALNTAPRGPDIFFHEYHITASHNLIGDPAGGSGITHGQNGNIVNSAPQLGLLADNGGPTMTMALLAGSPAIDAALSSSCPARDQRGVSRSQGSGCDIGAFEREPEPITVTLSINPTGTVNRTTGAVTVSGTVNCSASTPVSLEVIVSQPQKQGKTTVTVTGLQNVSVSCNGSTPWTAVVSASGGSFKNGSVTVMATENGSNPTNQVTQAVSLSWVR